MRRNDEKHSLIAVFNNQEIAREVRDSDLDQFGRDLLKKAGISNEPDDHSTTHQISFYEMKPKNDKMERVLYRTLNIVPWTRQRTEAEFEQQLTTVVSELPEEFQLYIRSESWDRGHASGYDEVLSYARGMVAELKPAIQQYTKRLNLQHRS